MSAAEIADNKWEVQATKAPTTTPAGIAQILLMGGFAAFFGYIVVFSIIAIVTPKGDGLAGDYKNLNAAETPAAE